MVCVIPQTSYRWWDDPSNDSVIVLVVIQALKSLYPCGVFSKIPYVLAFRDN